MTVCCANRPPGLGVARPNEGKPLEINTMEPVTADIQLHGELSYRKGKRQCVRSIPGPLIGDRCVLPGERGRYVMDWPIIIILLSLVDVIIIMEYDVSVHLLRFGVCSIVY